MTGTSLEYCTWPFSTPLVAADWHLAALAIAILWIVRPEWSVCPESSNCVEGFVDVSAILGTIGLVVVYTLIVLVASNVQPPQAAALDPVPGARAAFVAG